MSTSPPGCVEYLTSGRAVYKSRHQPRAYAAWTTSGQPEEKSAVPETHRSVQLSSSEDRSDRGLAGGAEDRARPIDIREEKESRATITSTPAMRCCPPLLSLRVDNRSILALVVSASIRCSHGNAGYNHPPCTQIRVEAKCASGA
jgi:hypothetical protein